MPLVVFIECIGLSVKSDTIEKYLKDPVKSCRPVRDLPPKLKKKVIKNLTGSQMGNLVEMMVLLAYMGLVSVPPEPLPMKRSQIQLYLNTSALLVDTTLSERTYCQVCSYLLSY